MVLSSIKRVLPFPRRSPLPLFLFAAAFACALPLAGQALAGPIASNSGAGCLDIDFGAPAGANGAGRNVIVWPDCHGGPNQQWTKQNGVVSATVNGTRYCLDINMSAPAGGGNSGRNVIAWPNCHGGPNQRWVESVNTLVSNAGNTRWCLDVNMGDARGGGGSGRNVIAWPNCHGGPNQKWRVQPR